ncbi:MAG: phosphate ABC transporter ATP-binding protein [Candidatus Omnitrophica bacterium]|nr:phosphate ABC transporter ATP-binding protein [Candidatus Omnitrophota bacterium]
MMEGSLPRIVPSPARQDSAPGIPPSVALLTERLSAWFGESQAVKNVALQVHRHQVTAIIGPSGCGKSTFIRCLNRMHEVIPEARVEGRVWLDGWEVYAEEVDPVEVRRRIGMVFQKPNPFPTMTVYDNVAAGLRLNGVRDRAELDRVVEEGLRLAALWDEVKDKLKAPGTSLSGGQQQRLCIARALAIKPEVLLMDEPCSALDPIATGRIEELIYQLKQRYTVVLVTHNMQQAARVSDFTGFLLLGELVEVGPTAKIFTNPSDSRTEAYITGRFG